MLLKNCDCKLISNSQPPWEGTDSPAAVRIMFYYVCNLPVLYSKGQYTVNGVVKGSEKMFATNIS